MGGTCTGPPGHLRSVEADYNIQYSRDQGALRAAGSGAFAEVRACTHRRTHELRACKTIDKKGWFHRQAVIKEIHLLSLVRGKHGNIIDFVEYYEDWSNMHLIFEYCAKGSVQKLLGVPDDSLAAGSGPPIATRTAAGYIWQLFNALEYLKGVGILHRDVKPANLLLKDESNVKLADFGVSCACSEDERLLESQGTPAFFSPEMHALPKSRGYSFPADIWAAGITAYMMLFVGEHPFREGDRVNMRSLKVAEFSVGWTTSSAASSLLGWLLLPSPRQRISVKNALRHPWLASSGYGPGDFTEQRPAKLVMDSHGNWLPYDE